MTDDKCQKLKPETTKVYLVVHEIFGIFTSCDKVTLVTPYVSMPDPSDPKKMLTHTYAMARFNGGKWISQDWTMNRDDLYTLDGVLPRESSATPLPCRSDFSPHPTGKFSLSKANRSYLTWELPIPKHIHQLRTVAIPETCRQLFLGDPHGDAVDAQLNAISLVHVFEYDKDPDTPVRVNVKRSHKEPTSVDIDCSVDEETNSINLHLWAQLKNEVGMDGDDANAHAKMATDALIALFNGIQMEGGVYSLSIDNLYSVQSPMPLGVRMLELMTLAERSRLIPTKSDAHIFCTYKTCGHGGTVYVDSD
jgi:hypothetical protein